MAKPKAKFRVNRLRAVLDAISHAAIEESEAILERSSEICGDGTRRYLWPGTHAIRDAIRRVAVTAARRGYRVGLGAREKGKQRKAVKRG